MAQKVTRRQFSYVALGVFGISGTVLVRVGNQKEAMFSRRGTLFRPGRTRTHADDDEVSFPRGDVLAPRPSSELDLVELRAVSAGESIAKTMTLPIARLVRARSRKFASKLMCLFHLWSGLCNLLSLGNRYQASSIFLIPQPQSRSKEKPSLKQNTAYVSND